MYPFVTPWQLLPLKLYRDVEEQNMLCIDLSCSNCLMNSKTLPAIYVLDLSKSNNKKKTEDFNSFLLKYLSKISQVIFKSEYNNLLKKCFPQLLSTHVPKN